MRRARVFGAVASCPHAASMSRPRVSRTVAGMCARSSTPLNAAMLARDEPSYIPVGMSRLPQYRKRFLESVKFARAKQQDAVRYKVPLSAKLRHRAIARDDVAPAEAES